MRTLCYLSTNRLHRVRASLIQTLKTVGAMDLADIDCLLWMPPWKGGEKTRIQREKEIGAGRLPIRTVGGLHSRWPKSLFASAHMRQLRRFDAVYVRSAQLSLALSRKEIVHHLEIHTLRELIRSGALKDIIEYHQQGIVRTFIPITRAAADILIAYGGDPSRIVVAPSGVSLESFSDISIYKPHRGKLRAIYLGSISSDRGSETLSALGQRGDLRVTVVGRLDNTQKPEYCEYQSPIPHDRVPGIYAQADIVLMPYKQSLAHADGISPMKLFEAMAAGRPIVVSDLPPIREIITHGHNALLADPDNIQDWHDAIDRIQCDTSLAIGISTQARKDVKQYSWEERVRKIIKKIMPL